MKLFAHTNGTSHEIDLVDELGHMVLSIGNESFVIHLDDKPGVIRTAFLSGGKKGPARKIEFGWTRRKNQYRILIDGISYEVDVLDARAERAATLSQTKAKTKGPAEVRAPIPGRITKILADEGAKVAKDQPVLTLDAMKLENEIQAPKEGTVRKLAVQPGVAVEKGQLLFVIE